MMSVFIVFESLESLLNIMHGLSQSARHARHGARHACPILKVTARVNIGKTAKQRG